MKVLHVSPSMDPKLGGVCQAIRIIISGLSELGADNEVVSLDAPNSSFLKDDRFPVHAIGVGKGPWSQNPNLIAWLIPNLPSFDAVVVHGLWLYYGYAVRKAIEQLKGKKPKLFVMPHGMLDPYFQRAPGRKFKAFRNYLYWKLVEGKLVNGADGLLFTCEEERLLAREPFRPYQPKQELVVGLGTDPPPGYTVDKGDRFYSKLPAVKGRPYVLFLSRIHEKKGVDLLIPAYANLAKKAQDNGLDFPKLVIAGPGLETQYGMDMQRLAYDTLSMKDNIFFPGMLTGNDKWGAFYNCEAFVLPSHQENFGIAVIEALACGKAVLISNQVNIWREIETAGGGIVGDDTLQGTQAMLENWISFSELEKRAMGTKAQACFKNAFAKGPSSKRFLAAINR